MKPMTYGSRPVTKRDRELAIKRELINSRSNFKLTPGMRRALSPRRPLMENLPDIAYKAFWTAVAAVLAYLSTVTIDVGPEWTPLVTTVFTAVLVAAREWVARRNTSEPAP